MPQLQWNKDSDRHADESVAIEAKHSLTYEDGSNSWFRARLTGRPEYVIRDNSNPWHLHVEPGPAKAVDKEFSTPEEGMRVAQHLLDEKVEQVEIENSDKREKIARAKAIRGEMEQKIDELLGLAPPSQME